MKYLLLENIRSAYNVGAIFRTADATGVEKIFLVGHTPTPIDRFGRTQSEIKKTSLGASEYIAWEHHEEASDILKTLQSQQIAVVAVEQTKNSLLIQDFVPPSAVVYVLGNEVEGVSEAVLAQADTIIELPMLGRKESLNVSVTAGVVLYHGVFENK